MRNSVEAELHVAQPKPLPQQTAQPTQQQYYDPQSNPRNPEEANQYQKPRPFRNNNANATPKQVNYLLTLAKRAGWSVQQILARCQIPNIEAIPSKTCSQLIQELAGMPA